MTLNANKLALAATITMGMVYVVCGIFTAVAPDLALKFLGWMLHLVDVEKFAGGVEVTFRSFVPGLLPIIFYSYAATYIFARLYNRFVESNV